MDLAPPPVGELYVNHEELIAVANTWAEAHGYALLNIKRSSKNKRGIKDKIWLKCDRDGKNTSSVGQKRLHAGSRSSVPPQANKSAPPYTSNVPFYQH